MYLIMFGCEICENCWILVIDTQLEITSCLALQNSHLCLKDVLFDVSSTSQGTPSSPMKPCLFGLWKTRTSSTSSQDALVEALLRCIGFCGFSVEALFSPTLHSFATVISNDCHFSPFFDL